MEKRKLLIATTNEGKVREIKHFLGDLPFELVTLNDLDKKIESPEEVGENIEEIALLKARYYANKTGLLSLAEDGGVFVDAFDGWPGVISARIGKDDASRCEALLDKMKDVPEGKRSGSFRAAVAIFDPGTQESYITVGRTNGRILTEPVKDRSRGFGYDPIFYLEEEGKAYAEMTVQEKNSVSHRGKGLSKVKYFLMNHYGVRHVVVTSALIIKDGKILLGLRNDPHRAEYHKKWEFPGGVVEAGETLAENVKREVKEEVGYDVEVVSGFTDIIVDYRPKFGYQIYIIPLVCKIVGGNGELNDAEVLETKFVNLDEVLDHDLLAATPEEYRQILPELKKIVEKNNL